MLMCELKSVQFSQHGGVQAIKDAILDSEDITLQVS